MPRVYIKGPIISDEDKMEYEWWGIQATSPSDINRAIENANGEDLEIIVNSGGGDVPAAVEMMESLREYKGKIVSKVIYALSAATIPITIGEVEISPSAIFMIHNASTYADGDYRVMDSASQKLQVANKAIRKAYLSRTNISEDELINLMDKETWMGAEEAINYGLADRIMGEIEIKEPGTILTNAAIPLLNTKQLNIARQAIATEKNNIQNHPEAPVDNKKGGTKMKLKDLCAQYPEVAEELNTELENAATEAVAGERKRIQEIEDISNTIDPAMVSKAKFDNPVDAKTLAFNAMKSNSMLAQNYLKDAQDDSDDSHAGEIKPTPETGIPEESEADKDAQIANKMAERMNAKRKAGR